jgi:hypothetical protein
LFVDSVESKLPAKFLKPAHVYLCNSNQSFCKYTGSRFPGPRAYATFRGVYVSPRLKGTPDWAAIVYHELIHVVIFQHLSVYRYLKVPVWFHEGFATYISNGGGSGNVSDSAAVRDLLEGRHFDPVDNESILSPKSFRDDKIGAWTYYRQSMLFVGFLAKYDRWAFDNLISSVLGGTAFPEAVANAYGHKLSFLWEAFVADLKQPQTAIKACDSRRS